VQGRLAEPVERVQGPGGQPVQASHLGPVELEAPLQGQPGEGGHLAVTLRVAAWLAAAAA
jgi:hypothetical protein